MITIVLRVPEEVTVLLDVDTIVVVTTVVLELMLDLLLVALDIDWLELEVSLPDVEV